ncbi:cysteine synthase family protein [Streptomyces sp. NBC_01218]|uniref:PLP-dependent cysteine synthase family protein n=1 Tax=unclassified Streptomyces TaxID=2593676 RepID=UPI0023B8E89F|nr:MULTISPECIES: cysteine synthase family protein [unclassified Streptomyces]WEH39041.1 cysteine synthase family protein [Streptomyces sp. AM 2-1-1]WSQ50697.1 cysteine synthase family protein [Streptomyces sp. NBC_01218]
MANPIAVNVADSSEDLIGDTPLLKLRLDGLPAATRVLAKLEAANPLSSIKDRAALFMMRAAEKSGALRPGATVIESTSGNTGIALASLATVRGYPCRIVLPDNASRERVLTLRMLGAEVEFTDHTLGFAGCVERAEQLHARTPDSWYARQHENPDNVRAHYESTGPEIWRDTGGRVDHLVCTVGTGGTLTGIARFLRERNPDLHVVAVEPEGSALLSGGPPGPHRIPGLNGGFISPVTDTTLIDEVIAVSDKDAAAATRAIATTSGLLVGVSSGAAAHGCVELARRHDLSGATVVTVFPDTGERYLSWWPTEAEPAG